MPAVGRLWPSDDDDDDDDDIGDGGGGVDGVDDGDYQWYLFMMATKLLYHLGLTLQIHSIEY